MAAKDALDDLQQEVTCPLCLDTFEDPRVLACQHTYCKSCLDSLVSRVRSFTITCPECRKPTDASVGGVGRLPVAFKINRLKQLVSKMQLEERASVGTVTTDGPEIMATPPQGDASSCKHHPNQTLDVYCRECEEVVCRDCILFATKHASHPYDKLEVAAAKHRDDVAKRLALLLRRQPTVKKMAADVKNTHHCAEESHEVMCTKIAESYDRLIGVVERKKQSNLQQFRRNSDDVVKELGVRETTLTKMSSEISAVKSFVDRGLKKLGNIDFITRKKGMILKIDQMTSRISNLPLDQPEVDLSPQVVDAKSVEEIELLCDRFLRPYRMVDPLQCSAQIKSGDSIIKVSEVAFVSITLKDSEGDASHLQQCVTVELCSARFGEKLSGKVMVRSSSCYEATFTPNTLTRGQCQLVVKVNEHPIGSKPTEVFVECPPQLLGEPVCLVNDIQRPGCLRIVDNRMFCRTTSGIYILDLENISKPPVQSGMFPREGKIQNWWPSEMAVDNTMSFVFVSDPRNCMVHKFAVDGQYLMSTASNKVTLKTPNGLCVAPDGALYVCDSDNHCIHVFNWDLTPRLTFGSQGSAPGQFCWPDNVAFDSSGHFYVTDYRNHRIQCFTSDHKPKWCTGTQGSQLCDLNEPNVMHVFGSNIFVTDLNGVSVFDTSGQFVTRFASMCAASAESKSSADGITVDQDGFVYVSDTVRNRIIVF